MDGYRTYDDRDGRRGSVRQWRAALNHTMGLDEAKQRVGALSPEAILGLTSKTYTRAELASAYKKAARATHPDLHPGDRDATERFKRVSAAFTLLDAKWR